MGINDLITGYLHYPSNSSTLNINETAQWKRTADLTKAGQTLLIADGINDYALNGGPKSLGLTGKDVAMQQGTYKLIGRLDQGASSSVPFAAHNNAGNIAYVDGHAQALADSALPLTTDASWATMLFWDGD
jgi:prepilin-type processing-associated H-X9-DG protein